MTRINRRAFLQTTAGAASAAALFHTASSAARAQSANDRIVMALVGCGGRGGGVIRGFAERKDVQIAWVCDCDTRRGESMAGQLSKLTGQAVRFTKEMHEVYDDKGVGAVVVATPDHWHALATIRACQAGKDVYVEKPPSHNVWEGRKMVQAARKYKRIVQVGTQGRSAPYMFEAVKYIQDGKLGKVHLCKVFNLKPGSSYKLPADAPCPPTVNYDAWLGPAPTRTFNPAHFHGGWHKFWAYCGGEITDDGIHQTDLARWLIGKDYPKSVYTTGGKFAFPDSDNEIPDTEIMSLEFDDCVMTVEMTQFTPYMDKIPFSIRNSDQFPYWPQCSTRIELYGTKGVMLLARHGGGWQVYGKAKEQGGPGTLVEQRYGRFPDPEHQQNFVDCIRSRKTPNADIEEGHRSSVLLHLGNVSYRVGGRKLTFDPKTETTNDADANALVRRSGRKPYEIPDEV